MKPPSRLAKLCVKKDEAYRKLRADTDAERSRHLSEIACLWGVLQSIHGLIRPFSLSYPSCPPSKPA